MGAEGLHTFLQRWGTGPVEVAKHVQDESTGGDTRIRESTRPTSTV
jgi:hypothetical protein